MKPDRFPLGFICGIAMAALGYLAWANKSDWDTQFFSREDAGKLYACGFIVGVSPDWSDRDLMQKNIPDCAALRGRLD